MRWIERLLIEPVLLAAALFTLAVTVAIIGLLGVESIYFFADVSLAAFLLDTEWSPLFTEKHYGIWPLISGTLLTTFIAMVVAAPVGLCIAIYLSEYASAGVRAVTRPLIDLIAGVPTVVLGFLALMVVTPTLQATFLPSLPLFNALSPSLMMGLMILPTVVALAQDALDTVPDNLREAGAAVGAHRFDVVFGIVVPAAKEGIFVAWLLAGARAIGETMIVTMAAGQQPHLTANPLSPVETMTTYIAKVSLGDIAHDSVEYRSIFVVAAALFALTFLLNQLGFRIRGSVNRRE